MIVVEYERLLIIGILLAAYTLIAGAQVTCGVVPWHFGNRALHRFTRPGPVLAVRGNDDPLFTQGMPSLFPNHDALRDLIR